MGVLKKYFKKKQLNVKADERENQNEIKEKALGFYKNLKAETEKPITYFTLEKKKTNIFDCKIGGAYFVPEEQEIPIDKISGNPLFLLTQINFSQLKPIENFPTKGLLQIFISGDDDVYGCDFDNYSQGTHWTIRYIEEIPEVVSKDRIILPETNEEITLPFPKDAEYALIEHHAMQTITTSDYRFNKYFNLTCKELMSKRQESFWDLDDDLCEYLMDKLKSYACQIDGYPFFTQEDPRNNMREEDIPNILLFQLDTVEDIMWGDCGVANFFISENDLRNKDFSKVIYNWDCL